MNKKGFVASSILYSFLIIFVTLIMTIIANYAHNRVLMNRISDDIKKEIDIINDNDISGAIAPEIGKRFTPITYVDNQWIVANSNNKNAIWYNYRDKKWANAVLTSKIDKNITEGSHIDDDIVKKYGYVWIPRFRYQIFSSVDDSCTPYKDEEKKEKLTSIPSINVIFEPEEGASNAIGTAIQTYRVPNAFLSGYKKENNIKTSIYTNGFWVKKYPELKNNSDLNSLFYEDVTSNGPIFYYAGIENSKSNHIIRNAQWGAVAYLAYSKYGFGSDNSNSTTGNESGVYFMNHFNKIDDDVYSKQLGEITVYTDDSNFYENFIFPIEKKPEYWKLDENSGDAMCETNIKGKDLVFLETSVDIKSTKSENIKNYFFNRGYSSNFENGIFSFQETTASSIKDYYVRDVYENIPN